jgi:flagellar basal-body rod protein FlgB
MESLASGAAMIDKLNDALYFQQHALNLRQQRQQVLATNIANAATPNYKARDFDFAQVLKQQVAGVERPQGFELRTTAPRHLHAEYRPAPLDSALEYRAVLQPAIDGNTVDMDVERAHFADNTMHYQASLSLLNTTLTGLRTAMQPE